MARLIQWVVAGVALLVGVAFHVRNGGPVALDFYVSRLELPLSLVVVAAMILGALLGALAMSWRLFVVKRELGRLRRRAALAEPAASSAAVVPVRHGT
ncbi:MAG: LapA family protein [Gammaproteobacteria bacterium]|nr:LapA family protein [Gammaproteobacteria bacterium]MBI5614808.1 LapA family protein [Gammaproteobacteria bacterium]